MTGSVNKEFDPDDIGVANGNYFGLPCTPDESDLVLLSAPWDVTVSYAAGTARGPEAIIEASTQVELRDSHYPDGWRRGIATIEPDGWIAPTSEELRSVAEQVIEALESGAAPEAQAAQIEQINQGSRTLNSIIRSQATEWLDSGKLVGLVGGDHSTPLGLMQAISDRHGTFGILHIDAHADLRVAYEGFEFSHASIMHNALQIPSIERLVQVAIRDYCNPEAERGISDPRIVQFTDQTLATRAFEGVSWAEQCGTIIDALPQKVYISFDIDGLSPDNCPGTGTPVPGGLGYNQAIYLLAQTVSSGRCIVGFDLTEVAPTPDDGEWNANIGARVLYKLCNLCLLSQPQKAEQEPPHTKPTVNKHSPPKTQ